MADKYGTRLSADDPLARPPGTVYNAGQRVYQNVFDLADDGGAQHNLVASDIREGNCVIAVVMQTGANLSGINFTIGTDDDPDKYGAAQAGPNATEKRFLIPIATRAAGALEELETIKFFPDAALPGAGIVVTEIVTSKR